MPECHKCKYNGTGNQICLACKGPGQNNNHGKSHVSLDASDAVVNAVSLQTARPDAKNYDLDLQDCCLDAVRRLLAVFSGLEHDDLSLVLHLLRGETQASWGSANGLTRQAVGYRVTKIINKHAEIAALINRF